MLRKFRELLDIVRIDPAISSELPIVRRLATRAMLWLLVAEFFLVFQVFPVKFFIDELSSSHPSGRKLALIALSMLIIHKISTHLQNRKSYWRNAMHWRMWRMWWGYGHRRGLRLSADWHVAHGTGEKDSMIGKNIIKFENMIIDFMFATFPAFIRITYTTILMFFIGWHYGVLSLLTQMGYGLLMWISERHMEPMRKEFRDQQKEIEKYGSELTSNWRTIKEMGREEDFCDVHDQQLINFCNNENPRHLKWLKFYTRQEDVITISRFLLFVLIGASVLWQGLELGTIVLAATWMERSYSNYGRFSDLQERLNEGLESLRELVDLMCLPATVQQPDNPVSTIGLKGTIVFDNVHFRYPEASDCTIRGVSFVVPAYTATALVGQSGCGKTTLASLMQRLYDPTEGSVLVDNIDLKDLDYDEYRRHRVSIISQETKLFDTTILENIRMSSPDATDEEVFEASKRAYVDEFVLKLPKSYHTMVGDDGVRLSGGQKQRIAIARALLRKPALLIMDEATSSLDALSQRHIQRTIDQLIADRLCTVVIIAHRFPTIMGVDQVVVLKDGCIAEIGTHDELKRMNGLYMRLRNMEADGLLD